MQPLTTQIRRPVEREGAEYYVRLLLISFAASVALTRLFLELTGYPQLGNQTLHIAHLLWGGLLLFVAALLMILYANRWTYRLGALLAGAGVGLFIDEVGKFITRANDYFYPPAAPIIYAFFLLVVLLYLEVRRPNPREARAELYRALDTLEEVLDRDLDAVERASLEARLRYVAADAEHPDLAHLAGELLGFLRSKEVSIAPRRRGWIERLTARARLSFERWATRQRMRAILAGALAALGLWAMRDLSAWMLEASSASPVRLEQTLSELIAAGRLTGSTTLTWLAANAALKATCGLLLLVGAWLLTAGREKPGVRISHYSLLLLLTVVDLMEFYFEQFSTIVPALLQFTLLLLVLYFRRRYVFSRLPKS